MVFHVYLLIFSRSHCVTATVFAFCYRLRALFLFNAYGCRCSNVEFDEILSFHLLNNVQVIWNC